jgi:alcohol dehydrogenase class IV
MAVHDFFIPRGVFYGPGALARLGTEAARLGRKALVVTGSASLRGGGGLGRVLGGLRENGVAALLFEGVEADPSTETVDRGTKEALAAGCDMVVAVGGGSALDAGKAIAGVATNGGPARDYLHGKEIERPPLPCVAVPTTAGTGSEVTKNAVITDRAEGVKRSIRHRLLIPAAAVVDPELTYTLPPAVTAATGMDALAQLIEPYVSRRSTPLTDALALHGIALVGRCLARAVRDGRDAGARAGMSLASLLSGMALANAGLGAAHALSHPLGARFAVPHGLGCAILLPRVMSFNAAFAAGKYARVAEALGADVRGLDAASGAEKAAELVAALSAEIGIPAGLSTFGVTERDIPAIAREARGSSLDGNPVAADEGALAGILRAAL